MVLVTNDSKAAPELPPPAYTPSSPTPSASASTSTSAPAAGPSLIGPSHTHGYSTFQPGPQKMDPRDIGYPAQGEAGRFEPAGQKTAGPPGTSPNVDAGRTVYYYRNPMNGATITSFLPPDHPRSLCLQYGHVPLTTHGILGILAAVIFFPIGVLCCMIDRRSVCARCGEVLSDGCS